MQAEQLRDFVVEKLEDLKGRDIKVMDVREQTDVAEYMIICSGSSKTHVRSLANYVAAEAKHHGVPPIGVEGHEHSEWVLVDLADVVVHIMQESIRDFYELEKLWGRK
ncbi:ribosome silencing factor [Pseudidiomarina gelatinasegens]|uniref:Ribosomal silencing factor RsfS n=1 Tax=Pseudidiomarina gelatinasegens TaxID=2487740 RepID=A0A443Z7A4_9GAMM|nr:ribosome silencing factor [Pseudidiomarina gelatinasegens]RWU12741.1 ribosome silencing factor [Pseudidiomarina gelatinasegens]